MTLYNVEPTTKTFGRRCINVIQMFVFAGQDDFLSNIVHLSNVGSMFGQHRRRWPSFRPIRVAVFVINIFSFCYYPTGLAV